MLSPLGLLVKHSIFVLLSTGMFSSLSLGIWRRVPDFAKLAGPTGGGTENFAKT